MSVEATVFFFFFFALWITLLQCVSMWLSISSLRHEGFSVIPWHLHSTLYLIAFEDSPSLTSKLVQWEHCQSSRRTEKELPLYRQNVQPLCSFVSSELLTPVRVLTCFFPAWFKKRKKMWKWPLGVVVGMTGMRRMACFTLVTCPQVYHVSAGVFAWRYALWHLGRPRWHVPSHLRYKWHDTPKESRLSGWSSSF